MNIEEKNTLKKDNLDANAKEIFLKNQTILDKKIPESTEYWVMEQVLVQQALDLLNGTEEKPLIH